MAKTDLETLVVRMEAQMKAFENELKRGRKTADRETRAIEKRFADANKRLAATFAGLGGTVSRGLGFLGIGFGAREIQKFADQYTSIQNALKVAGLEGAELTHVYDQLFASAQKNAAPLEALTTLYGRASLVQKELKISTEELLQFTDKIALALRVSGQSAEQSSGALLQLSQALGSGVVRAEEFNSILEGALPIAQAAAAGLEDAGGSVAKLRALIVEGKVSSEAFFRAFQAGSSTLEARAAGMQMTIGQAFTLFNNVLVDSVGRINNVTGASAEAVRLFQDLGNGAKWVADQIEAAKAPFREFVDVLRQIDEAASSAARWLGRVSGLANVGPALGLTVPQRGNPRIPEFGLSPEGRAPAQQAESTVRLSDFPVTGAKAKVAKRDPFERALDSASKRIEVLKAETAAIDGNTAARERAKLVAELEVAAKARNEAAGLKNIEVTDAQRAKINELADAMYRVVDAAEEANSPLRTFAREGLQVGLNLEEAAVSGLRSFEDAIISIADKSKSTKEAFRDMASSIIADIGRVLIRAGTSSLLSSIFSGFGGAGTAGRLGGTGLPGFGGLYASGGFLGAGKWGIAGENGPEIVRGPAQIIPNSVTRSMMGNNFTYAPAIDARGADAAAVARLERSLMADRAAFESRVKKIVANRANGRW